ncbi:MAG: hypothetical protein GY822_00590 [Deltaproteobacteria bacterium]|nr:hypothetical protein [Deltaproteobacteria bacterium]
MIAFVFSLLTASLGCTTGEPLPDPEPRQEVRFELQRTSFADFLALPWPSDLHKRVVDGETFLDLRAFPNPTESATLEEFLALFQSAPGWQTAPTFYFQVQESIDVSTLPEDANASMLPDASLFVMDLETEERLPVIWKVLEDSTAFLPAGTVQVQLLMGARLTHRSALVLTSAASTMDGVAMGPSKDLAALMDCAPLDDEGSLVQTVDCTPFETAASLVGEPIEDIALLQILTPARSEEGLEIAADTVRSMRAPALSQIAKRGLNYDLYEVYSGIVELAQFQVGVPPFYNFDGVEGGFEFDGDDAVVQNVVPVEFRLTVPKGVPPATGWPVVVYGHGTGGSLDTPLGNSVRDEAHQLASTGWSMITASEPMHRTREGYVEGSEELYTFNMLNPVAGRNTFRQSALEKIQLISAIENLAISAATSEGDAIEFDDQKIAYLGHSQGGIVGAIMLGVESRLKGAFLSGAGAGFAPSLVSKTEPVNLMDVFRTLLNMPEDEPVDIFHPVLALLQLWVDPSDPINYADGWRRTDTHLVMTSGFLDTATPRINHDALAGAFRLPVVEPVRSSLEILEIFDVESIPNGTGGNISGPNGPLTGGLLQYEFDGHFAIYRNPAAIDSYRVFFETLNTGIPVAKSQ